jgi:hypothetical protein
MEGLLLFYPLDNLLYFSCPLLYFLQIVGHLCLSQHSECLVFANDADLRMQAF